MNFIKTKEETFLHSRKFTFVTDESIFNGTITIKPLMLKILRHTELVLKTVIRFSVKPVSEGAAAVVRPSPWFSVETYPRPSCKWFYLESACLFFSALDCSQVFVVCSAVSLCIRPWQRKLVAHICFISCCLCDKQKLCKFSEITE